MRVRALPSSGGGGVEGENVATVPQVLGPAQHHAAAGAAAETQTPHAYYSHHRHSHPSTAGTANTHAEKVFANAEQDADLTMESSTISSSPTVSSHIRASARGRAAAWDPGSGSSTNWVLEAGTETPWGFDHGSGAALDASSSASAQPAGAFQYWNPAPNEPSCESSGMFSSWKFCNCSNCCCCHTRAESLAQSAGSETPTLTFEFASGWVLAPAAAPASAPSLAEK